MSCIKKLEKILSEKNKFKEISEKIENEEFFEIENKNSFLWKSLEKFRDNWEVFVINEENYEQILNWEISEDKLFDIRNIKLYIEIEDKDDLFNLIWKFRNLKSLDLLSTELGKIDWITPEDLIKMFINLESLGLWYTKLDEIDWITEELKNAIENQNFKKIKKIWEKNVNEIWLKYLIKKFKKKFLN